MDKTNTSICNYITTILCSLSLAQLKSCGQIRHEKNYTLEKKDIKIYLEVYLGPTEKNLKINAGFSQKND